VLASVMSKRASSAPDAGVGDKQVQAGHLAERPAVGRGADEHALDVAGDLRHVDQDGVEPAALPAWLTAPLGATAGCRR
jgi:hypothetical protein